MNKEYKYYIKLLEEFQNSGYGRKLELFEKEFDILNPRNFDVLIPIEEKIITTLDFDILPKEGNPYENKLFNEKIYEKIDLIILSTKTHKTAFAIHELNLEYSEEIYDKNVSLFNYESLEKFFNKSIRNLTTTKQVFVSNELKRIKKYIDKISAYKSYDYIRPLYNKLLKGGYIDFSQYSFGSNYFLFLGIKIAENLAKYTSKLVEFKNELNKILEEFVDKIGEKKSEEIKKITKQIVGNYIDKRHQKYLIEVLEKSYTSIKNKVGWKSSMIDLILFIEYCVKKNIIHFDNEDNYSFIERNFYSLKHIKGKTEKKSYKRSTLQSESSKYNNKEIQSNFSSDNFKIDD